MKIGTRERCSRSLFEDNVKLTLTMWLIVNVNMVVNDIVNYRVYI
jgi:hypothetical protein